MESGELRLESVVRAGEEAPGERSPPNWELHYRIPFGLVSFADCLNSRFVNLLVLLQQTLD